jgi:hypothetical protein
MKIQKAISIVIPSKWLSVSSNRSRTAFKCPVSHGQECWSVIAHSELAFAMGKEQAMKLIESELYFMQCANWIHIGSNEQWYSEFVG